MNLYKDLIRPRLFDKFGDPEEAHERVLKVLKNPFSAPILSAYARLCKPDYPRLKQTLWGLDFSHPIGIAAGFDKNGVALLPIARAFLPSHIEMGGITKHAQSGNPRQRIFRSKEDEAIINRMGFNNDGAEAVGERLSKIRKFPIPLGLNVGKSKVTPIDDAVLDYCHTVQAVGPYVDYITVNVSSPNTPDLRLLQEKGRLAALLSEIQRQIWRLPYRTTKRMRPLLVKLAPDLAEKDLDEALEVAAKYADGIIATNTTTDRTGLISASFAGETGGLSGAPLRRRSLAMVRYIRKQLPRMPIIGVGGLFNGDDMFDMVKAGANLLQVYTGLIFEGPFLIPTALDRMNLLMDLEGTTVESYSAVKRD